MTQDDKIAALLHDKIAALLRELADAMKLLRDKQQKLYDLSACVDINSVASDISSTTPDGRVTVEEVCAALTAKYRDKPLPPLSDALRKKLGACIPEIRE